MEMKNIIKILIILITSVFIGQITFAGKSSHINVSPGNNDPHRKYNFTYQNNTPIRDHIIITNRDTVDTITIHLSSIDGYSNSNGQQSYKNAKQEQEYLGNWIKFQINDFILAPNEEKTVNFTISPTQNALPGLYTGAISTEEISAPSDGKATKAAFSVKVQSRIIKGVYLKIPGTSLSEGDISNLQYFQENNERLFTFDINNKGNTMLTFKGELNVEGGLNNDTNFTIPVNINSIQNNSTLHKEMEWPKDKYSWGNFEIKLNGTLQEYNPFDNIYTDLKPINLQTSIQLIPWNYIMEIGGGVIFLILLIIIIIISKKNYLKHCDYYEIVEGDNLKDLAMKHGMNWKKIVHINKLSAPYDLKPGAKLLLRKINEIK